MMDKGLVSVKNLPYFTVNKISPGCVRCSTKYQPLSSWSKLGCRQTYHSEYPSNQPVYPLFLYYTPPCWTASSFLGGQRDASLLRPLFVAGSTFWSHGLLRLLFFVYFLEHSKLIFVDNTRSRSIEIFQNYFLSVRRMRHTTGFWGVDVIHLRSLILNKE